MDRSRSLLHLFKQDLLHPAPFLVVIALTDELLAQLGNSQVNVVHFVALPLHLDLPQLLVVLLPIIHSRSIHPSVLLPAHANLNTHILDLVTHCNLPAGFTHSALLVVMAVSVTQVAKVQDITAHPPLHCLAVPQSPLPIHPPNPPLPLPPLDADSSPIHSPQTHHPVVELNSKLGVCLAFALTFYKKISIRRLILPII